MEVNFYQAGCKNFFKKHVQQTDLIKSRITAAIDQE